MSIKYTKEIPLFTSAQAIKALLEGKALKITETEDNVMFILQKSKHDNLHFFIRAEDQDSSWIYNEFAPCVFMHLGNIGNPAYEYEIVEPLPMNELNLTVIQMLEILNSGKALLFKDVFQDNETYQVQLVDDNLLAFVLSKDGNWEAADETIQDIYDQAGTVETVDKI